MSDPEAVGGEIKYYGLIDWWLHEFSPDEQAEIRSIVEGQPSLGAPLSLTEGEVLGHFTQWGNRHPVHFLTLLALNLYWAHRRDLARRVLEKAELYEDAPILDRHFLYSHKIELYYRDRDNDPEALEIAIAACEAQIELAPEAASEFRRRYTGILPSHKGFEQLAIVAEKQKDYDYAIWLSEQARAQGWTNDWDKRIARCTARVEKLQAADKRRSRRPSRCGIAACQWEAVDVE